MWPRRRHARERGERDGKLGGPAAIDVMRIVERPIHVHRVPRARGPGEIHPLPPTGERRVEQRVRRRDLDLVVSGEVAARVEEDLHDVGLVQRLVVARERRRHVRVLDLERDVQVLVVPQKPRHGLLRARPRVERAHERPCARCALPSWLREHSVDVDRSSGAVDYVLAAATPVPAAGITLSAASTTAPLSHERTFLRTSPTFP